MAGRIVRPFGESHGAERRRVGVFVRMFVDFALQAAVPVRVQADVAAHRQNQIVSASVVTEVILNNSMRIADQLRDVVSCGDETAADVDRLMYVTDQMYEPA